MNKCDTKGQKEFREKFFKDTMMPNLAAK